MDQVVYKYFAIIVRDHITKKETIDNEKIPNVFKILLCQQINEDGFKTLMKIIQLQTLNEQIE